MKKWVLLLALLAWTLEGSGCAGPSKRTSQDVADDANLTVRVRNRLAADAALSLLKIDAEVSQGVVTLTGSVPTEERKKRAAEAAASIEGVRAVENLLQVGEKRFEASFDDAVITSKITTGLIRDPLTHSLSISVETKRGKVVLSGRVRSEEEKREAERIALNTDGVVSVENRLQTLTE